MKICTQRDDHRDNRSRLKERNPTDQLIMVVGLDSEIYIFFSASLCSVESHVWFGLLYAHHIQHKHFFNT